MRTWEIGSPWITHFAVIRPLWSRLVGRSRVMVSCAICGNGINYTMRVARLRPSTTAGRSPLRSDFVRQHQHTAHERANESTWVNPPARQRITRAHPVFRDWS